MRAILLILFTLLFTACEDQSSMNDNRSQKQFIWEEQLNELYLNNEPLQAERESKRLLKKYPDNSTALNILGLIKFDNDDLDEAEEYFKEAIKLRPESGAYRFNLAQVYFAKEDIKAVKEMELALKYEPDSVKYMIGLGYYYSIAKKYDKAIEVTKKALLKDPENHLIFNKLGEYYLLINDGESALKFLKPALELDPENRGLVTYISIAYYLLGDYDDSLKYSNQLLNENRAKVKNYQMLGHCYYLKGDYRKAEKYLKVALKGTDLQNIREHDALSTFEYEVLGLTYFMEGKVKKAYELFNEIYKLYPDEPISLYGLGEIYYRRQDYESSEFYFKKYLEQREDNVDRYISITDVETTLKRIEEMKAKEGVKINEVI